jgi:hypothetical protein
LSPRGWNGTRASRPHDEQVAVYIWRAGRSLGYDPLDMEALRAARHSGHREGVFNSPRL